LFSLTRQRGTSNDKNKTHHSTRHLRNPSRSINSKHILHIPTPNRRIHNIPSMHIPTHRTIRLHSKTQTQHPLQPNNPKTRPRNPLHQNHRPHKHHLHLHIHMQPPNQHHVNRIPNQYRTRVTRKKLDEKLHLSRDARHISISRRSQLHPTKSHNNPIPQYHPNQRTSKNNRWTNRNQHITIQPNS